MDKFARDNETDMGLLSWLDAQPEGKAQYIKRLIREDMTRRQQTIKRISIDNGNTWVTPEEAINEIPWQVIVEMMDDDTREQVHAEIAPCTEAKFLSRYLELAPDDLIIG